MQRTQKILFVGDDHHSKTHTMKWLTAPNPYTPATGATVVPYGSGNIWDIGSDGLRDGYFVNATAFVIFGPVSPWIRDVTRIEPDARLHIYRNKAALKRFIDGLFE
jgi:hypothetical protein